MRILTTVAAMFVGGAIAAGSVYGLVASQTAAPTDSPANVDEVVFDYGSNN
ncbi:hypothetical protein [uncultured Nocardioides sp.]|uniref:hypothetical protein n=1 Tax=uncultured Nocardioides sp. TaxID=198441 RepID=UPI002635CBB2|nr:hypothetical protein [uncultured Nocardioides sp.]